ncbi:MAG: DUF4157 domain-containing protein [Gemmatimonadetes bacterium]|nr:DUF4157 domain-containing protein [Gemmatimonadota bacterium]
MLGRLFGREVTPVAGAPHDVVIRAGRIVPAIGGRLSGMRGTAAAVTIGRTIIVHPGVRLTDRLLRHELAHVRQWERAPLTFPLHYVWQTIRHGYRDNPYEVEARAAEFES